MAARTVKIRHDDETRAKIQTSQLINRLTAHALGDVEMPATAVTAALGLIRKTLPDLASTTLSGDDDADPINLRIEKLERVIVDPPHRDSESVPAASGAGEV